jgi:hypothetical protein
MEREGFVNESVVTELLNRPLAATRLMPQPQDLILGVDDVDYAGWQLSPARSHRTCEVPPQVINALVRRATPPSVEEPGIGIPHFGNHRWWLAGLAGVLSTMLFSILLLSLSSRGGRDFETTLAPKVLAKSQPMEPEIPEKTTKDAALAAQSGGQH